MPARGYNKQLGKSKHRGQVRALSNVKGETSEDSSGHNNEDPRMSMSPTGTNEDISYKDDTVLVISDEERKFLEEQRERERLLEEEDADEIGFESSPEHVTDDDIFGNESEFEAIERTEEGGGEKFWEVEESNEVEDEEAPPRKVLRDPGEPTKEEWEAHRIDHIPYRSWCPHCVKSSGTGLQHRRISEEARVPVFGFDYLLGSQDINDEDGQEVKVLVAKCQTTKCVFSHVVPQKGLDPKLYAVERLRRDVLWLGHTK